MLKKVSDGYLGYFKENKIISVPCHSVMAETQKPRVTILVFNFFLQNFDNKINLIANRFFIHF